MHHSSGQPFYSLTWPNFCHTSKATANAIILAEKLGKAYLNDNEPLLDR